MSLAPIPMRHPVVSVNENYDCLRIPPDGVARDARYKRYLNDKHGATNAHVCRRPPPLTGSPPVHRTTSCCRALESATDETASIGIT